MSLLYSNGSSALFRQTVQYLAGLCISTLVELRNTLLTWRKAAESSNTYT